MVALLDTTDLSVDDTEAIDAALDELGEAKPYLLEKSHRRIASADQGSRGQSPSVERQQSGADWFRSVVKANHFASSTARENGREPVSNVIGEVGRVVENQTGIRYSGLRDADDVGQRGLAIQFG